MKFTLLTVALMTCTTGALGFGPNGNNRGGNQVGGQGFGGPGFGGHRGGGWGNNNGGWGNNNGGWGNGWNNNGWNNGWRTKTTTTTSSSTTSSTSSSTSSSTTTSTTSSTYTGPWSLTLDIASTILVKKDVVATPAAAQDDRQTFEIIVDVPSTTGADGLPTPVVLPDFITVTGTALDTIITIGADQMHH